MTIAAAQVIVNIPTDIVGQLQAAGSGELTAAGFTVAVAQQVGPSVAAGHVITTQPAPGTAAPRGSAVKLIVSQGPGPATAGPISNTPGLTPEQVAAARGLEKTCDALASTYTAGGTTLTAKQLDLLNKCKFPHGIAGFIEYGRVAGLQSISMHELNIGLRVETGLR